MNNPVLIKENRIEKSKDSNSWKGGRLKENEERSINTKGRIRKSYTSINMRRQDQGERWIKY